MKKNCILLITHNRTHFLKRFLEFYKNKKYKVNFVIACSGDAKCNEEALKLISNYHSLLITSFFYDQSVSILQKICETLKKIQYEIIAFCADDDYILPEAFNEAAEFLEKNPDYVSVSGYMFAVGKGLNKNGDFEQKIEIYDYQQIPINIDNSFERLQYHLNFYTATFYNTYRKKDLLKLFENSMRTFEEQNFTWRNLELFLSAHTMLFGKTHILENLYMVRQAYNPISCSLTESSPQSTARNKKFKEFHTYFINELSFLGNYRFYQKYRLSRTLIKYFSVNLDLKSLIKDVFRGNVNIQCISLIVRMCLHRKFNHRNVVNFPVYYQNNKIKYFKKTEEFQDILAIICKYPMGIP